MLNSQESTTILNACTKKVWKLIEFPTHDGVRSFDDCLYGKLNRQFGFKF